MTVLTTTESSHASSPINFYTSHKALSPNPCFFPNKLYTFQCPGSLTLPREIHPSAQTGCLLLQENILIILKRICGVLPLSNTGLHNCKAAGLQPPPPDHHLPHSTGPVLSSVVFLGTPDPSGDEQTWKRGGVGIKEWSPDWALGLQFCPRPWSADSHEGPAMHPHPETTCSLPESPTKPAFV